MYTIGTAAKATGKAKSVISRAIKEGTISAPKLENGSYAIDPAELHRVFPPAPAGNGSSNPGWNDKQPSNLPVGTEGLQAELERLRERLEGFERDQQRSEAERERERRQLTDEIEFLRRSLQTEGEERRKLTAILTDQRETRTVEQTAVAPAAPAAAPGRPKGWRGLLLRLVG